MRIVITLATLLLLPSLAEAEEITLRDLHEGGILTIQREAQPCPDWAADLSNRENQTVDTYQGWQKFYWVPSWGNENDWKLYKSLSNHFLVVKKNFDTEECIMQLIGPMP